MGMLRLVRAYTGREKIIKFEGCYHGHADGFLVQAGSGVATRGLPDSPGVPPGSTKDTLVAKYNDLESVKALLKEHECAGGRSSSPWSATRGSSLRRRSSSRASAPP